MYSCSKKDEPYHYARVYMGFEKAALRCIEDAWVSHTHIEEGGDSGRVVLYAHVLRGSERDALHRIF